MADDESSDEITKGWAIKAAICISPLFFLFHHFNDPAKGRAACVGAFAIALAARMLWDLKNHVWFWVTVTIVVLLHVPLLMLIPWTNTDYPGIVLLPFALLDYGIVYGCIKLVGMFMEKEQHPDKKEVLGE